MPEIDTPEEIGLAKYLARTSLIAVISIGLIGAIIFISIYGVMRQPEADFTNQAIGTLLTLGAAVGGAIVALIKTSNGNGQ